MQFLSLVDPSKRDHASRAHRRIRTFAWLWDKSKVVGFKKKANSQGTFVTVSVASNKEWMDKGNQMK